jgi:hypothetical protein
MHAVVRTSPPVAKVASAVPAPTRSSPELEIVQLDVKEDEETEPGDADAARALFQELGWEGTDPPNPRVTPPSAVAVAPHKPPAPVAPAEVLPSVIVEDLDAELLAMVDRLASGEVDENAEGELLRQGERAMRAMLDRLSSSDPEVRGWAAHLVCELPYVEAVPRLVVCLRDADAGVSTSAGLALAAIAKSALEPVREALLSLAYAPTSADRIAALGAIAKLRDASFVPELVRALGDSDDSVVTAAHAALVQVTLEDLGTDARLWIRWLEQNSDRHRIEWLIDALGHDVTEIRKSAGEELRALTKEYFGYAGDSPPRDRDRAQQRYRDWWEVEGRSRFRRS